MNTPAKHFGLTPSQFKQLPVSDRLELIEAYRDQLIKKRTITILLTNGPAKQDALALKGIRETIIGTCIGNCCDSPSRPPLQGTSAILDIETLATSPQSIITEIAIIIFDRATHTVIDHLEIFPDFFEQLAAGRAFDPDTLNFHRKNGTLPTTADRDEIPWLHAIVKIEEMLMEHKPKHVWIQGTDFDRPIIEDFCKAKNQPLPWRFSKSRDARTTYDLAFPGEQHAKRPHRALQDCEATLADLIKSLTKLNALASI